MKRKVKLRHWLIPGLGLKRWAVLGGAALGMIVVGLWSLVNNQAAKNFTYAFVNFMQANLPDLTFMQGLICIVIGFATLGYGVIRILSQYMHMTYGKSGLDDYYENTSLANGPNLVVIGGGTGLSVLLKGLKRYTSNITAAVTVGDDGGSSGRLREEFGVIPVGDIRACIVALADEEDVMEKLFNYRFARGEGLKGHSLGNLLLLALTVVQGSFQDAVSNVDQILHMTGRVLPITMVPLTLKAKLEDGTELVGESNISEAEVPITSLTIEPRDAKPVQAVLKAIEQADAILLGPGSLYTSIIPNLCVEGVVEAIQASEAPVFYVCNVMTQPGETTDYSVGDHLEAIIEHSGPGMVSYVLADDGKTVSDVTLADFIMMSSSRVTLDKEKVTRLGAKLVTDALVAKDNPYRHDHERLAARAMKTLYYDKSFRRKRGWLRSYWDYQKIKAGQEETR